MSDMEKNRKLFAVQRNPSDLSGWTYLGRIVWDKLPDNLHVYLRNVGDAFTVDKGDRHIRYVNRGMVTASSKIPVIDFYKRKKPHVKLNGRGRPKKSVIPEEHCCECGVKLTLVEISHNNNARISRKKRICTPCSYRISKQKY